MFATKKRGAPGSSMQDGVKLKGAATSYRSVGRLHIRLALLAPLLLAALLGWNGQQARAAVYPGSGVAAINASGNQAAVLRGSILGNGKPAPASAGEPNVVTGPQVAGDENWDGRIGTPGANSIVYALATSGSNVYAGGNFTTIGGIAASGIARWDGSGWSALGNGVSGGVGVLDLEVSGATVYVLGQFSQAGNLNANGLAKWDGSNWSVIPGTFASSNPNCPCLRELVVSGNDLYVGGYFDSVGGVVAAGLAKWNGSTWSAVGGGLTGSDVEVRSMAGSGNDIYIAGTFETAGSVNAHGIAKWNGNQWSALGSGMDGSVLSLAASGSNLYASGTFRHAGGTAALHIAKWNGSAWSALGSGIDAGAYYLLIDGTDLYAGGEFTNAGGVNANDVAKWDGNTWSALGNGLTNGSSGFSHYAMALTMLGTDLYVGGNFKQAGDKAVKNIAVWHRPGSSTATPVATNTPQPTPTAVVRCPGDTFPYDVCSGDYYYDGVKYLAEHGAISGYTSSPPCPAGATPCFNPFANSTRGQLAKIVVVGQGWTLLNPSGATFGDVPVGSAFFSFVETAVQHGIISGYTDNTFRPNNNVTRSQLSKIIVLARGWSLVNPTNPTFVDVERSNTFYQFVETAVQHGIISGYELASGSKEFRPGNNATRGQIAKIVYLAIAASK